MNGTPVPIDIVLVFREPEQAQRLGGILQAALRELENLFNYQRTRIQVTRHLISETPIRGAPESEFPLVRFVKKTWSAITGETSLPPEMKENWNAVALGEQKRGFWEASKGKFVDTVNPEKLLEFVRSTVRAADDRPMIVVVDQRITPPPGYVYIIGKTYGPKDNQAIISTVPLDPAYWNLSEPNLQAIIKQRFRASCASFIGKFLGTTACPEPACYMYLLAQDPEALDWMVRIGVEHTELEGAAGRGYSEPRGDATIVQEIEQLPQPKGRQAFG